MMYPHLFNPNRFTATQKHHNQFLLFLVQRYKPWEIVTEVEIVVLVEVENVIVVRIQEIERDQAECPWNRCDSNYLIQILYEIFS